MGWIKGRARQRYERHGQSGHPLYCVWYTMHQRCANPTNDQYHNYGGRGIKVCERWQSFATFLSDMGDRPNGTTLDRRNNDGDYGTENCRWATPREQMNNVRYNRILTVRGEKMTQAEASRRFGVDQRLIDKRIKLGWSVERAATQQTRSHHWRVPRMMNK